PVSSRADPFAQYQPYTVDEDKIEYAPAWPGFVDSLLESLRESGDTMVLSNRPMDVFYVVALTNRHVPTMPDLYKETAGNRQLLLGQLELERQKEYRKAFLEQLRREANLTVNEEGLQRLKQDRSNSREE